jgi:hypothetical protein
MLHTLPTYLDSLNAADLEPLVAAALGAQAVKLVAWTTAPMGGGSADYFEGLLGVHRVTGTVHVDNQEVPFSLVAKGANPTNYPGASEPSGREYWKREALLYQSGLLDHLLGTLTAPHCLAVVERTAEECWMWFEEIRDSAGQWNLETYGLAARHLGQFNGAYLCGQPLPEASWLTNSRMCEELAHVQIKEVTTDFAGSAVGQRLIQLCQLDRVDKLLSYRQPLLRAAERLPLCFTHQDAFRRNLFIRKSAEGREETVAIDWAYAGVGRIGEDAGFLTRISLAWLEVPASERQAFSQAVWEGYLAGLHDAGWQGNVDLARFGYALTIAMGIQLPLLMIDIFQDAKSIPMIEKIVGRPLDDILVQTAELQPFLLAMGDEAISLLDRVVS